MKKEEKILHDHEINAAAAKLRPLLNESATQLPADIATRLAHARRAAVERAESLSAVAAESVVANGSTLALSGGWKQRALDWRFWATGLLIGSALAVYVANDAREAAAARDAADVELMILGDDVPVDALLDRGFKSYLREEN
jgi:hypothetical protein